MHRSEPKEIARGKLEEYLGRITERKGDRYICPVCGSGTGVNKTPAGKLNDDYTYHCFSCGFHGDIFSLVGKVENIMGHADIFKRVYEIFNFHVGARADARPQAALSSENDYTEYFKECHARSGETDYFSFRGLGEAVINKFMLGYDPAWRSPKALREGKNPPASRRIIIPTGRSSYIARAVDPKADLRFRAVKEGASEIFNKKALHGTEPVFVVEGEIDALSVIEAGGQSLALGGLGNKNKFINLLMKKENPPRAPVIILSLDNDEAGRKAQTEIADALRGLKATFLEQNISGQYKDPNEHLTASLSAFRGVIRDARNYALLYVLEHDRDERVVHDADSRPQQVAYCVISRVTCTGRIKSNLFDF